MMTGEIALLPHFPCRLPDRLGGELLLHWMQHHDPREHGDLDASPDRERRSGEAPPLLRQIGVDSPATSGEDWLT